MKFVKTSDNATTIINIHDDKKYEVLMPSRPLCNLLTDKMLKSSVFEMFYLNTLYLQSESGQRLDKLFQPHEVIFIQGFDLISQAVRNALSPITEYDDILKTLKGYVI